MSFGFPPKGWALCDGQLLPINQNQALFSLLGTTYGGDGRVNFGLPNLQGRAPIHMGSGHTLGERGGEQGHTLSISEIPTRDFRPDDLVTFIDSQANPIINGHVSTIRGNTLSVRYDPPTAGQRAPACWFCAAWE